MADELELEADKPAEKVELKSDHPERYTVVNGDTLWDISSRFLKSPWLWASIWNINEQVENPHLIYPGDVILLSWSEDGKPVLSLLPRERVTRVTRRLPSGEVTEVIVPRERAVARPPGLIKNVQRLTPKIRYSLRDTAIPTIQPDVIAPFLTRPRMVGRRELDQAGYVTIGVDDRRALGNGSEFYARGIKDTKHDFYYVFRKGEVIRDAESNRILAYEAVYLGDAKMINPAKSRSGTSKLLMTRVTQEILPTDRLLPVVKTPPLPLYYPRSPKNDVKGSIVLAHRTISEIGPYTIVAVDLGEEDGLEDGHVLRVWRHVKRQRDPVTGQFYQIPDEESGLLLVFKTFERVSYGLVLNISQPIHILDRVTKP